MSSSSSASSSSSLGSIRHNAIVLASTYRLAPQMRVDIAAANATFLHALYQHAAPKRIEPVQPTTTDPSLSARSITLPTLSAEKAPGARLHIERPFSVGAVRPLESPIPSRNLPEELLVFDRGDATGRHPRREDAALRYVRAYPRISKSRADTPGAPLRRGYLFLDRDNKFADGRRAAVYRAPLVAALGPTGGPTRRAAVVAKLAKGDCRSQHLLRQEGKAYAMLPTHVQGAGDGDQALVPNFYGLYVPVDSKGRRLCGDHPHCDGYLYSDCAVDWPSPILLMEDCGGPIDVGTMGLAARRECWSLIEQLHAAGVAHGSAHARNILVQPGPLSAPKDERSMATPSYRLASLGRAEVLWPRHGRGEPSRLATHSFEKTRERDMQSGLWELRPWEEEKDPPSADGCVPEGHMFEL